MKIAIWGLGVSGKGALKYLSKEKKHEIFVVNKGIVDSWYSDNDLQEFITKDRCFSQDNVSGLPKDLDFILQSPGIDPRIEELRAFDSVKKVCDIEYVCKSLNKPIIAITGTNGKTSTVTMIHDALCLAEKKVFVGGNIGVSPFEALEDVDSYDFFVFEMSSFQLELIDAFKPNFSAVLNVSPSHMERYDDFKDYVLAKLNITRNQDSKDKVLLPFELIGLETAASKVEIKKLEDFNFSEMKVLGPHMKENFFVVDEVFKHFKIENREKIIQEFIDSFSGVKFRLQYMGTQKGVDFYNDAKSTNTESTITALKAFGRKNVALILGGKLRDETQDFKPGLKEVESQVSLFLFGESRDFLREQLEDSFRVVVKEDLEELIDNIVTSEFDVVLFSPGFPSFDQYKNYIDRGEHFDKIVEKLF